ncbi:efflux RND transporter periplasmic adaptor subunit [Altericroceibacterium endophyticum]|uniref:Efflux RND transporter periplasmic adaptor subunit n=1 Tax=Altericroceibacterium endophyticum TaxID=1808508 RepID=A0A6I4T661_9SPHN|nr:efflux RND transporter periplasmic adaptor subunit [Altericroceibacterium endophyticum]MXO65712.1 efflux RND transporter periplasmic adaptor subunit [Altericroceibacterium endophyticum]
MNYEASVQADYDGTPPPSEGDVLVDEQEVSRRKRVIIIGAVIGVLAVLALLFMMMHGSEDEPFQASADQLPSVTVAAPGTGTISGQIMATGTLAARREMPVGIAGEGGRVVSVPVDAGEWVKAGQVLAVIDRSVQNQQVNSARAQIDARKADARLAQANLDRALKLVDRGFISTADVDRLTATRDAANAQVKIAEAQYQELVARSNRLNVTAPASGLLLERNVEPGQVVSSGSGTLFSIAKGGEMELLARLSEDDLAKVSVGSKATVTPVGSGEQFTGQVWQVSPTIDPDNRQGLARIALSYAKDLRPGGFASAQINGGSLVAPRLPESAIQSDEQGSYVFIVKPDNTVAKQRVQTGVVTEGGIAIIDGLDGTEKVVLRAGGFLNEGDTVKPVVETGEEAAN